MISGLRTLQETKPVKLAKALAIFWVALSLSETAVTFLCLRHAGNIEGNPFARSLLMRDEALFYGVKLLITVSVGLGFWLLSTRTSHVKAMILCEIILVIIFTFVLVNNIMHL
jgi:hypothetical protein